MHVFSECSKIKEKLIRKGKKMCRERERMKRKLESNPIAECNRVQKKFCPNLFELFSGTADPRNRSYTRYNNKVMLGTVYYKGIAGLSSVKSMTYEFNNEDVSGNILQFLGEKRREYLPHGVTINEYLEKLEPEQLQDIQQSLVYDLIRRKTFDDARFQKRWLVIVDATQMYSGSRKINEKCLERHYNRGTENETVNYHCDVLEAKIYFGEKLIVSIGSEFIENNGEDTERQKNMSVEELKQDCETKAFKRLAARIKKKYKRLPITLMADSLYASETVMNLCRDNSWEFIIRYKTGSIPSIQEEYENIKEKESTGHSEYINEIDYRGKPVNVLKYWEEKQIKGKTVRTEFQWLTSIKITPKNAEKIAATGRKRWKIENEGFNRQKNWQGDITHACSWNEKAIKNHYLILQISDMIKQLYEWFYLAAKEIKKRQKNISSELLASFGRQLTGEDISQYDMHGISDN